MDDPHAKPLRTLVVDPSEAVVSGILRWARGRRDLVVAGVARSGREALAAVERLAPDLVLVDAVLPELDGLQVVRAIKARPDPPLAVVTTLLAEEAVRQEAFAAGADGFVPKDDFALTFELLLEELLAGGRRPASRVRIPERSARRESRNEPDP